jgi:hypothetical protein
MKRNRYTAEQIIRKLNIAEQLIAQSKKVITSTRQHVDRPALNKAH